jgi:phosphonopyruvate decarboxylase
MINSADFVSVLFKLKVSPFLMVPCSIFKHVANWMVENKTPLIIAPNEAHAIGFANGSYSATKKLPVIFLQNSGLNNIANAQTSLNLLYKIPALLIVSWRGEKPEAPEHNIMGTSLKQFFKVLQIPYAVLSEKKWQGQLKEAVSLAKKSKTPVAVVVRKGFFEKQDLSTKDNANKYPLSRLEAIKTIKEYYLKQAVFISTNGHPSRDSFSVSPTADFYMMGSMGHAFSMGAGVSWQLKQTNSKLRTIVFDGDGGCLMHLGSLALVNLKALKESNLIYVVLDNEAYESTGSQPCLSAKVNFTKVAEGLGFPQVYKADSKTKLEKIVRQIERNGAAFIHIKVNRRKDKTPRVSDNYTCEQVENKFIKTILKLK